MPDRPAIASLFRPKVWLWSTALVLSIGLASDGLKARRPVEVVYVGTSSASTDTAYRRLLTALDRLPPERRAALRMVYRAVRDEGPAAAAQDLRRGMRARPALWLAPTGDSATAVRLVDAAGPLVFASYPDPVLIGLVDQLSRPGKNATGVWLDDDLHVKRLELLQDGFPLVRTVGVLIDRSWTQTIDLDSRLAQPAAALGLQIVVFAADDEHELAEVMSRHTARAMDAWYVPATYLAYRAQSQVIAHLARLNRPAIHATTAEARDGALMAYSLDTGFAFDALAALAARVASGEDAGSIPVQRPRRHALALRAHDVDSSLRAEASLVRRADILY